MFGSDERFFGTDDEVKTIEDLYAGRIEDTDEGEVDAASFAYQIAADIHFGEFARAF